ncbi:MAG TPA: LysM peptidoglycan-binding domain-containing protein [Solirubrobacteraceae bacterium]|jgi:soluble lytic murein transglycosylase-like protein|nr:LysM peptidoglycan-binding domain-containing protein [Solirubrobacteraceae bacterium]
MRRTLLLTLAVAVAAPAAAPAAVPHTVQPGETLWAIAAANNLTTRTVAAFNGLSGDSHVVLGSTIMVPTVAEGAAALGAAPVAAASAPPPAGAYTVQPGDTFTALAARTGVTAEQVASVNGLDVNAPLIAGTAIKLPPASAPAPAAAAAASTTPQAPQAAPVASGGRVTSGDVHAVAAQHGVPGSLAAAIAWQESGFNNAMVSSANARGVMQVMPGTWDWVQRNLAARRLDPASAVDNVHAGTLYLGQLLRATGGDPALAAAGYYQGLESVRRIGMLPETQRYVANVMALRSRFGG